MQTPRLDYIILDRRELNTRTVVQSFDAANAALGEWRRNAAPGGEDVMFIILWRDNGIYRGEYRMDREEHQPDLRAHVRRHLEFIGVFMEPDSRAEAEQRLT